MGAAPAQAPSAAPRTEATLRGAGGPRRREAPVSSRNPPFLSLAQTRNRLKKDVIADRSLMVVGVSGLLCLFAFKFYFPCLKSPSGILLAVIARFSEDLGAEEYF